MPRFANCSTAKNLIARPLPHRVAGAGLDLAACAPAMGCGGVPNALYSYHLATRKASTFHPAGGGMCGRRGAAVSPEDVVYMVTGDAMFSPQTKSQSR